MWASQLLTINTNSNIAISFNFRHITPSYGGLKRVEVVMFNCPEWGILVDSITLLGSNNNSRIVENDVHNIIPTNTSCDSLVRVCISISVDSTLPVLTLRFQLSPPGCPCPSMRPIRPIHQGLILLKLLKLNLC